MTGKRAFLQTTLLLLTVSAMSAADVTAQPGCSVLFILDLSYSMNLPDPSSGLTRIETARKAVGEILDDGQGDEEWALIGFSDKSMIELLSPFTRSAKDIRSVLQRRKPWGTTPLPEALRMGLAYLKTATRSPVGAIVLLSDCLSTEGDFSVGSLRNIFDEAGARLFIIGFPVEDNPALVSKPSELADATQGGFYLPARVGAVSLRLRDMEPRPMRIDAPSMLPESGKSIPPAEPAGSSYALSSVPVAILWGVTAVGVILMALSLRAAQIQTSTRSKKQIGIFHFEILSPPRERRIVSLKKVRVRIGTDSDCDLRVGVAPVGASGTASVDASGTAPVGASGSISRTASRTASRAASATSGLTRNDLAVELEDGLATLRSENGVLVNGVMRRDKRLKEGDLIRLDGTRIAYRGLDLEEPHPRRGTTGLPRLVLSGAGLLSILVLAVFLTIRAGASRQSVDRGGAVESATVAGPVDVPGNAPASASATASEGSRSIPRIAPIVNAPGEAVPTGKADVLLFHAHPDDESIDFGCLIAKASRAGKTVVQVTLTDGESGLDYHEERDENHALPQAILTGNELAAVRIGEERNALSILGARRYVRFGLRNHPYNTASQAIPRSQLLSVWGGEAEVVKKIVALLETLQPEVVVSPDRRSAAREHFEHEAVGDLVRTAIAAVQRKGGVSLKAHLVSVDPRQRSVYRGLEAVDGMAKDALTGLTFRDLQSLALAEHMTQRDASVIGREILANFRFEYYLPVFWKLPTSLDEWLSG